MGVASLLEGRSQDMCWCQTQARKHHLTIREAGSLKVKGPLYSCHLCLPSRSIGCLIDIWKPSNAGVRG